MSTQNVAIETPSIDQQIGERVHQLMWRKTVPQHALGAVMGIQQSSVSRKLRGATPWTVADLYAAASVLGVEVETLLPHLDSNQKPFD